MRFLENIFSIKNENTHKVIRIFGLKLKFKSKYLLLKTLIDSYEYRTNKKFELQEEIINQQKSEINQQKLEINQQKLEINQQKSEINQQKIEINKCFSEITKLAKKLVLNTENHLNHDSLLNKIYRIVQHNKLNQFEIHLTEHCNLGCKSCTHFSPLAKEEFTDINDFKKDIERMSFLTNKDVDKILLLGGEPLLHPNVKDFMKIARYNFPNTNIELVTNGSLVLSQNEEFWQVVKEYRITIAPTFYPLDIKYDEIEKKCKELDIQYRCFGNKNGNTYWKHPLDIEGKQNATLNFINCWESNTCVFLKNGKIYTCVVPPNIEHFNKYFNKNLEVTTKDYVDIYRVNNITDILEFLAKPIPFCKYCKVDSRTTNNCWELSKKDINEWI